MASDESFVIYVCDQAKKAGHLTYRKMFGEYAIYCNAKVVALVCDNQLFVKPTSVVEKTFGPLPTGIPYPGAKPSYLITDKLEDQEWLSSLLATTQKALPVIKPKKIKRRKSE